MSTTYTCSGLAASSLHLDCLHACMLAGSTENGATVSCCPACGLTSRRGMWGSRQGRWGYTVGRWDCTAAMLASMPGCSHWEG